MINRKILYGYQIRDGALVIVPEEQQTIAWPLHSTSPALPINYCGCFESPEYPVLPGSAALGQAQGKTPLENPRYTGKDGFPAAVDADTFQAARKKAEEKNAYGSLAGENPPLRG